MRITISRCIATISLLALAARLSAQAPPLTKEYIYLDSRLIAVDGPAAATPAPPSLMPSASTLSASASTSNHIHVTATGAWNVSALPGWVSFTSSTGNGNGDIYYSVTQNGNSQRSGSFVIAGMTFNITQRSSTAFTAAPTVSVSTAEAASGFFTFKSTSPYTGSYINYMQVNLNTSNDFRDACYLHVGNDGTVYLAKDDNSTWQGSGYVGSSTPLANTQCSIDLSASTVTISGNDLVARLKITFKTLFAGTKRFYMATADNGGVSPNPYWVDTNTTYQPSAPPSQLMTVTPPTSSSPNGIGSYFYFTVTYPLVNAGDPYGANFVSGALIVINSNLNGGTGCYISFSRVDKSFYMVNSGQSGKAGDNNSIVSPQCTMNLQDTFVTYSNFGQTVNIQASIQFNDPRDPLFSFPGVLGNTNSWILATDRAGRNSGWVQSTSPYIVNLSNSAPTYNIPPDTPANWNGPASSVIVPNLTKRALYTLNVNEPNTGNYMNWFQVYFGPTGAAGSQGGCYFFYTNLDDRIYLAYSNNTGWRDSAYRTEGKVLDNGICRILTGASTTSVTRGGFPRQLSLSLTIEFYNSHVDNDPLNSPPGGPSIYGTTIGYRGEHAIRFYSENRAAVTDASPWSALDLNNVWP